MLATWPIRKILSHIALVVNILVAGAMVVTCYAGTVDPRHIPLAAAAAMAAPIAIFAMFVLLVMDIIWWRRTAIFAAVAIAACLPSVLDNFPLNTPPGNLNAVEAANSFTLMTYNLYEFQDLTGEYPGNRNPAIDYIIEADPDVVCLQETSFFGTDSLVHITGDQIDTLSHRYPYILRSTATAVTLLSKYKATALRTIPDQHTSGNGYAAYALDIQGHRVAVFNVHLASLGLTDNDKQLFRDITDMKRSKVSAHAVKTELLDKISSAAVQRANETEDLIRDIAQYGGDNVVVCGDFNDVPGCWALRRLADTKLREVYPAVGLLYMRTFSHNRLYFRIDHVLWRGCMKPHEMTRGNVRWSDHFPLVTTFVFDDKE